MQTKRYSSWYERLGRMSTRRKFTATVGVAYGAAIICTGERDGPLSGEVICLAIGIALVIYMAPVVIAEIMKVVADDRQEAK